jgi:hypothetical protein
VEEGNAVRTIKWRNKMLGVIFLYSIAEKILGAISLYPVAKGNVVGAIWAKCWES